MFSLGEFESKLNEALERNSILEMELDDKDELAETVQRLRDEARDLKQEIAVRQQKAQKEITNQGQMNVNTPSSTSTFTTITNNETFISTMPTSMETDTLPQVQVSTSVSPITNSSALNTILNELQLISQGKSNANHFQNSSVQQQQQQPPPITPSTRISALNFVGDALRKVTVSCHQIFLLSLKRGNKSKIDLSFILPIVFSEFKNKTEYAD